MLNSSSSTLFSNTFPIFYEDNNNIALSNLPSDEIVNPYYCYDNLQSPMFYYDIEYYADFLTNNHDLTMIQQPLTATNSSIVTDETKDNSSSKGDEVMNEVVIKPSNATCRGKKRRRTSNKDRHSKIRTAHGLRDRRMRLSLEVARPFFRLQDILGYDKASRTVEWLLTQSKIAIEELLQSKNNGSASGVTKCTISSTSDCEVESIVVEQKDHHKGNQKHEMLSSINNDNNNNNKGKKRGSVANVVKEKRMRTTKEAMKKARDKARKRTLEKMLSKSFLKDDANSSHSSLTLGANCEMMERENYSHSSKDWTSLSSFNSYQQNGEICQSVPSYGTSLL